VAIGGSARVLGKAHHKEDAGSDQPCAFNDPHAVQLALMTAADVHQKISRLDELDVAPPPTPAISVLSSVLVLLDRPSILVDCYILKLAVGFFPWDPGGHRQPHRPLSKLPPRGRAARQVGERCDAEALVPRASQGSRCSQDGNLGGACCVINGS